MGGSKEAFSIHCTYTVCIYTVYIYIYVIYEPVSFLGERMGDMAELQELATPQPLASTHGLRKILETSVSDAERQSNPQLL